MLPLRKRITGCRITVNLCWRRLRDWFERRRTSAVRSVEKAQDYRGQDVCLFVSYTPDGTIKPYVRYHLAALRESGLRVVLILNTDSALQLETCDAAMYDTLILRDNVGFDFGGWADALRQIPSLWRARRVVLVNDSIFGPLAPLKSLISSLFSRNADLVGLTESMQVKRHIQSFFLLMNHGLLKSAPARRFWAELEHLQNKEDVINKLEVNFCDECREWGLTSDALFPYEPSASKQEVNPTLGQWARLIARGFPYLKVELLRDNPKGDDITGWRNMIADPLLLTAIDAYLQGSLRRSGSDDEKKRSEEGNR